MSEGARSSVPQAEHSQAHPSRFAGRLRYDLHRVRRANPHRREMVRPQRWRRVAHADLCPSARHALSRDGQARFLRGREAGEHRANGVGGMNAATIEAVVQSKRIALALMLEQTCLYSLEIELGRKKVT